MHPILRIVLAIVAGYIIGSMVNMALIFLGIAVVGIPEGVNIWEIETMKANIHLFEFKHFIFPFLAHAAGTLVGAFLAARIADKNKMRAALIVGLLFLLGGIANIVSIGGPMAFITIDLLFAYIPMAWLGGTLAGDE